MINDIHCQKFKKTQKKKRIFQRFITTKHVKQIKIILLCVARMEILVFVAYVIESGMKHNNFVFFPGEDTM